MDGGGGGRVDCRRLTFSVSADGVRYSDPASDPILSASANTIGICMVFLDNVKECQPIYGVG